MIMVPQTIMEMTYFQSSREMIYNLVSQAALLAGGYYVTVHARRRAPLVTTESLQLLQNQALYSSRNTNGIAHYLCFRY